LIFPLTFSKFVLSGKTDRELESLGRLCPVVRLFLIGKTKNDKLMKLEIDYVFSNELLISLNCQGDLIGNLEAVVGYDLSPSSFLYEYLARNSFL